MKKILALAVILSGIFFSTLPVSEAQTGEDTLTDYGAGLAEWDVRVPLKMAIIRIDELEDANVELQNQIDELEEANVGLQNEIDFLRERLETAYSQTHSAHSKIQTLETTVSALAAILGITLIIALYTIYALFKKQPIKLPT
jgi:peptidoglycan hydrolase CwlO-like protein